jgi:hypothetical protein
MSGRCGMRRHGIHRGRRARRLARIGIFQRCFWGEIMLYWCSGIQGSAVAFRAVQWNNGCNVENQNGKMGKMMMCCSLRRAAEHKRFKMMMMRMRMRVLGLQKAHLFEIY